MADCGICNELGAQIASNGQTPVTVKIDDETRKHTMCVVFNAMKDFMMQNGLSEDNAKIAAAGFCGNIAMESMYNPTAVNKSSKAYGLCQWLGERKGRLLQISDNQTVERQIEYIQWELTNTWEKRTVSAIKKNTTWNVPRLAVMVRKLYERPNPNEAHDDKRIAYAELAYNSCANG